MIISDKLAMEIYTIELFHLVAILAASTCMIFFWFKAKRSPLLYSFLGLIGMLLLWMIAKVFKTVSPNEDLRWFFIVVQYFGIEFSGFFLVVFAILYTKQNHIKAKTLVILALPPVLAFLIVLTNPVHMKFYSYFDFYRDSFGPLFFPTQAVLYGYLLTGTLMLAFGFTHQPYFGKRKNVARLFAMAILISLGFNAYYLLVKLTDVPFIFDFPFFDFTPISSTVALILFILPAFRYRFLDILPFAYRNVFDQLPHGMALYNNKRKKILANESFRGITNNTEYWHLFQELLTDKSGQCSAKMQLANGRYVHASLNVIRKNRHLLVITDVTELVHMETDLLSVNKDLIETNDRLEKMLEMMNRLAVAKTKTRIAQDVHDIFGHTLIVVLGLMDIASRVEPKEALNKISQAKELLQSGVLDLRLSLAGQEKQIQRTTLEKSILSLSNEAIEMDFSVQGKVVELNTQTTDSIYRVCQEAMTNAIKHGKATKITIILRFKNDHVELYIIDNGVGCSKITKSFGLMGMEQRIEALNGCISFGSDGELGFHLHLIVPHSQSA